MTAYIRSILILESSFYSFNESINKSLMSAATVQRSIEDLEATAKNLLDKQKNFDIPKDFNIESIMDKIDTLEKRK